MRHLLDSNVWIHYLKDQHSDLARKMATYPTQQRLSCSVVLAELLHGAQKYGQPERRAELIERTLGQYVSLAYDDAAARRYAVIRHRLQTAGTVIGPYDLQIAAICLANDLTLITNNVREFTRVPGLRVEDWTAAT